MNVPPTGTVTFLFSDIEGSTQLARLHPDVMSPALARHHAIVREASEAHNGYIFRTIGDEFNIAFVTALDALAAALAAQRALHAQDWGETPLRVRMGLHTGPATPRGDDYEGYLALSHSKRLMSVAYGGQILLSQASEILLRDALPPDITLRDLEEHRLKDFDRAEHIFQVVVPDLPAEFPPLQTLGAFPSNLPAQLTSFVGRENEIAEVKRLLTDTRLLTLTGVGGTGKTRLALQVGAQLLDTFQDGVWLVELAPVADPALVAQTIASALQLREQPGRAIIDVLKDYVSHKHLLIVLDNCEHLIEACAKIADTLLHSASHLKLLATSREALGIAGEHAYPIPSLSLPPVSASLPHALSGYESVRLFVDRALAVQPSFMLTNTNAPAVAEICRRLDGIPLAIELAAARVKGLSVEQIATRLNDRFRLLTGGSRTALPRQRTLHAAIDWSYRLLSEDERVLMRRLAGFSGGWTLAAAEFVCAGDGLAADQILDLVLHLVDKSLVVAETQGVEPRYRLLETIRQYAQAKLEEAGESNPLRDRHLEFFIRFAEETEPKLRSAEQIESLERVETEQDNLRTALAWSLESGKSESALQLAGALAFFWELRQVGEGYKWLDEALALAEREQSGIVSAARRAKAFYGAGRLCFMSGLDAHKSLALVEESLRLWRELGDKWWMAVALEHVGFMLATDDLQTSIARLEEGVALAREAEDRWPLALCLVRLASDLSRTDMVAARRIKEEGVALARIVGDRSILSQGLVGLTTMYQLEGNLAAAASVAQEALEAARALRDFVHEMLSLVMLVGTSCLQGDLEKAKGYSFQALNLVQETGPSQWLILPLFAFGLVALFNEQYERGVRLLAAGNTMLRQRGVNLPIEGGGGPAYVLFTKALERARVQLGPEAFGAAWAQAQQMTIEQALALATEEKP